MTRFGSVVSVALSIACVAICCRVNDEKVGRSLQTKNSIVVSDWNLVGVGRFRMRLPATFEPTGGMFEVRLIRLSEFLWSETSGGAEEVWAERISSIRARPAPAGVEADRVVETRELEKPLMRAVRYYDVPEIQIWTALGSFGDVGVWFEVRGREEFADQMLADIGAMARSFKPRVGRKMMDPSGFYTRLGVLQREFDVMEKASLRLVDANARAEVVFECGTIEKPEEGDRAGRLKKAVLSRAFPGLELIHGGKRTVAGMTGDETVFQIQEHGNTDFSAGWIFPGKPWSGDEPNCEIRFKQRTEELAPPRATWDAILNSVSRSE